MTKILRYAARSDVGRIRSKNDDSAYVGQQLAVVADGMGGHAGGNVASASTVLDLIHLDRSDYPSGAETVLADEIQTANSLLSELVRTRPELAGMGTTVTALLLHEDTLHFAHIGDSRAYRLKNGIFEQISVDHTFVQRLIDEGRLRPEEAESHPHKNVLMRVLGDVDASPELDLSSFSADVGERWMLCSDGLNAVVDAITVESVIRHTPGLQDCVDELVELTLEGGSPDNVTVVVFEVVEASADDMSTAALTVVHTETVASGVDGTAGNDTTGDHTTGGPDEGTSDDDASAGEGRGTGPDSGATGGSAFPEETPAGGDDISPAGDDVQEDTEESRHLNAAVLQDELASRPHVLVGSAALVAETGELPTVAKRTADRRAAMVLTHKTRILPPDADEDPEGQPPRGRRWLSAGLSVVVVIILVAGIWAAYAWTQTRYYVGDYQSHVAIFRGVSQTLGPIKLSAVEQETGTKVADLPQYSQQRVEQTIPADDLVHARQIVADLQLTAPLPTPGCPPSASPSAGRSGSTQPTAGPKSSAKPTSTPRPDATTSARPGRPAVRRPSKSLRPGGSATKPPVTLPAPANCGGPQ